MGKKSKNNIYNNFETAISFQSSIQYDQKSVFSAAKETKNIKYNLSQKISDVWNILDVGVGNGSFAIPFISELSGGITGKFHCFDISDYMLSLLKKNLENSISLNEKFSIIIEQHDAEDGLTPLNLKTKYDVIILTFVLHYLDNWHNLLSQIRSQLKNGGIFIQAEIIGDLRWLDGTFDTDTGFPDFEDFWREYFYKRSKYSGWNPSISVSNMRMVHEYIINEKVFDFIQHKDFQWPLHLRWSDILQWIVDAPVSSLACDLNPESRQDISNHMKAWLESKNINLNAMFKLNWGIRVLWYTPSQLVA